MDNLLIEQYLNKIQLLQEIELINEDIASFIKSFKPAKIDKDVGKIQSAIVKKDNNKIASILSKIKAPSISLDKLKMVSKKVSPDFNKTYILSKRVLQNSLPDEIKDSEMLDIAALAITARTLAKNLDVKTELKSFILKFRKVSSSSGEKNKLKIPPELINEAIIGYLTIGLLFGAIGYTSFVLATFTGTLWAPLAVLMVIFILSWWKKIKAQEAGER